MSEADSNVATQGKTLLPALSGALHIHVAFDVAGEIRLEQARKLAPAELQSLPRRARTPSSITYRPAPLVISLPAATLRLPELGEVNAACEATVFDFGAVSVAMRVPFSLSAEAVTRLARGLAEPAELVEAARVAFSSTFQKLLPAMYQPNWSELTEEYFVFELPPGCPLPPPAALIAEHGAWLAGVVRLEDGPLSQQEIDEALRQRICYSPSDLFVPEWSAAVLIDQDCGETLQTIEFA
ncbi:MAG TPA: hypothetical protein VGJ26_07575, partial [Pirellulales bacterium]